jgi:hypothetical protein
MVLRRNDDGFDEVACPFCQEPLWSDASVHEFCAMCGMGIERPETCPTIFSRRGEVLYFCCDVCLMIFKRDVF